MPARHVLRCLRVGSVIALSVALLVGCATTVGGARGDIARAMRDVASAAASAELSLQVAQRGGSTDAATSTSLDDMLGQVLAAQTQISEVDAVTGDEQDVLRVATERARECVDAINNARQRLSDHGDFAAALRGLEAATDDATELSQSLEKSR